MNTKSRPITVNGIKYRWLQYTDHPNSGVIIVCPDGRKIRVLYRDLPEGPMYGRQVPPKVVGDWIRSNIGKL